jgi:hypothetical protein
LPSTAYYRCELASVGDLDAYVREHSALPRPRASLGLVHAVADWGDEALSLRCAGDQAPGGDANDPVAFLEICGTVGMGRLLAEGSDAHRERLRVLASDARWRVRESVAMALQRVGLTRFEALITSTRSWRIGRALAASAGGRAA